MRIGSNSGRQILLRLAALVVLSLGMQACMSKPIQAPPERLHISALQAPIKSLDPIQASDSNTQFLINNAWDGLVSWSMKEGIRPAMADKWIFSAQKTAVTFSLRHDMHFGDGTPVEARHVVEHLNRLAKTPGYFQQSFRIIERALAPSRHELIIRLREPSLEILNLLAGAPARIVKRSSKAAKQWIGVGPYQPEKTTYGWRLIRDPHYHGAEAAFDEIRLPIVSPDDAVELAKRGAVDDLLLFDLSHRNLAPMGFKQFSYPLWAVWMIGLNHSIKAVHGESARCMAIQGFQSEKFVHEVMPDHLIARGILPGISSPKIAAEMPRPESRERLRGGSRRTQLDLYVPEELAEKDRILAFLDRYNNSESPVIFRPRTAPFRWMIEHLAKPEMPAFLLSFNAELPTLRFFIDSLHSQSPGNLFNLRNSRIDQIIESTRDPTLSPAFVSEKIRELEAELNRSCAAKPLMQVVHRPWYRSCVTNIEPSPVSEAYFSLRRAENSCKH
jgi:hypothetical protein